MGYSERGGPYFLTKTNPMKIRDRLESSKNGRKYGLVAASDGEMVSLKTEKKGWISHFPLPEEHYTNDRKPLHRRQLFKACDRFLHARWPSFRQVYPNGITHKDKIKKQ